MADLILTERRGDVLVVTLNQPERLNAAPPAMFDALGAVLADPGNARALLVTGGGAGVLLGRRPGGGGRSTAPTRPRRPTPR